MFMRKERKMSMKDIEEILRKDEQIYQIYQRSHKKQTRWNILKPLFVGLLGGLIMGVEIGLVFIWPSSLFNQFIIPLLIMIGGFLTYQYFDRSYITDKELNQINNYLLDNAIVEDREIQSTTLNDGYKISKIEINGHSMIAPKGLHDSHIQVIRFYKVNNKMQTQIDEEFYYS